eukprot:scaffold17980_cov40-Cyclotella_meneghiniana.AAC.2
MEIIQASGDSTILTYPIHQINQTLPIISSISMTMAMMIANWHICLLYGNSTQKLTIGVTSMSKP